LTCERISGKKDSKGDVMLKKTNKKGGESERRAQKEHSGLRYGSY